MTLWFKKDHAAHDVNKPVRDNVQDVVQDEKTDNQHDKEALHQRKTNHAQNVRMIVRMIAQEPSKEADMASMLKSFGNITRRSFQRNYLYPAMENGYIEQTIPNKPRSRYQKYRLTDKGRNLLININT